MFGFPALSSPPSTERPRPRTRSARRVLAGALTATLAFATIGMASSASPAAAGMFVNPTDSYKFQGVNWDWSKQQAGGNVPILLVGMSEPSAYDDKHYASVRAQADNILAEFKNGLGANTVRIPVNTATVNGSWWTSYKGIIDAATARGMNVDLSNWEYPTDSAASRTAWDTMWTNVAKDYKSNPRVYVNPVQEPEAYSTSDWLQEARNFLKNHSDIPRNQVILSGVGWANDVRPLCTDKSGPNGTNSFEGTYFAFHRYAFDPSVDPERRDYQGWHDDITTRLSTCLGRTIVEEFGAPMDTGVNYNDPDPSHSPQYPGINYSDGNFSTTMNLPFVRALTDIIHDDHLGALPWAGLGGRDDGFGEGTHETFDVMRLNPASGGKPFPSSGAVPLWFPNTTGIDRLKYAWRTGPASGTSLLKNGTTSNNCLDVTYGTTSPGAPIIAYPCHGRVNQQWTRTPDGPSTGVITVYSGSQKMCLDTDQHGTGNGTRVIVSTCTGTPTSPSTSQEWIFYTDGTIRQKQTGRCLDKDVNSDKVQLWDCWGGDNQKWRIA